MYIKKSLISVLLLISIIFSCAFVSSAASPTVSEIVAKAAEIIKINQGDYKSVHPDDNGALSIGWIQWHGNRALSLLQSIVNADKVSAQKILGTTLYNEVISSTNWSTRTLSTDEVNKISALIDTPIGRNEQDKLAASDIRTYVLHGQKLGIASPAALVYFADVENQCGSGGATRVANAAIKLAGNKDITLSILHQAALADVAAGKHASRRNKVYNYALLLGWEEIYSAYPYEIWTVNVTLNIRSGPGTSYTQISQYTAGTTVIVYEKTLVDDVYWGRTSVGWISLNTKYCTFVRSVAASTNAFKVNFNANGGTLDVKEKAIIPVTAINSHRSANSLIVYTSEFGATTMTNSYGGEVVIGADGIAKSNFIYDAGDSAIPAGGFVISAHGTATSLVYSKIQKGNYVVYNAAAKTIDVYTDYNAYIASTKRAVYNSPIGSLPTATKKGYVLEGWYDASGNKVTEQTTVSQTSQFTLTARWTPVTIAVLFDSNSGSSPPAPSATIKANGINIYRLEDMLVIYNSKRGAETNTNKYGSEASVNSAGVVTAVWKAGTADAGSHPIPSGGFVISGHGTSSDWIINNIKVGDSVQFNESTLQLTVYSGGSGTPQPIKATYGSAFGSLPVVTRSGYTFTGWYHKTTGERILPSTICTYTSSITLQARWTTSKPGDVDENGSIDALDYAYLKKELLKSGSTGYVNLDVNRDGNINAIDYAYLKKFLLSKK